MFSERSRGDFEPNRLARALAEARRRGPLLDLSSGNPTLAGIPYDAERIARALAPRRLVYEPEPFGIAAARSAVRELWAERGIAVAEERVIITASTSEAYAFAFKLLCDAGDQVLVPAPSYPLIEHLATLDGVGLVRYPLCYDGRYALDLDAVRRSIGPRTRAILVVSPNNPTGSYLKRAELEALARLGLPILSDEVFGEYPLRDDPSRARSALEVDGTLVIALDGLSKAAALPQVKLAWMTLGGPERVVRDALARLELIADTFLSPSTVAQDALPELLASRHVAAGAIRRRLAHNHATLVAACANTAVTPLDLEGGWYAVLRVPAVQSDEEWALALLADGVVVHPGYFYDFEGAPHLVVSLITPEDVFAEGIGRLVERVRVATAG